MVRFERSPNIKNWKVQHGRLGYEVSSGFIVPSAESLFSAIHEDKLTDSLTEADVKHLIGSYTFSKYPIDLKLIIQTCLNGNLQTLIYGVTQSGESHAITFAENVEHIVIENVWYPIMPGEVNEIMQILREVYLDSPGEISLGQYLSLINKENPLIRNEVESITTQFLDKKLAGAPSGIKAQLYPYQEKGWQWLRFMKRERIGGVLADEMGLGKTIQIIALLASEPTSEIFLSLIVCPTTLLENWRRELKKFSPQISSLIHHGPHRTGFPNDLRKFNVIITSYDTVLRDISLLNQINWKLVICDEAQAIKNPLTRRAVAIKQLPRESGFAVTGTPIENSLNDLWSLMDFALPGYLGTFSQFQSKYASPDSGPSQLEKVVSPLILRRLISEVARDLPEKIIIPQIMELSEYEIGEYERIRIETLEEFDSNASLVVLTRLRMFCVHPVLVNEGAGDLAKMSNKYRRLLEIIEEIVSNSAKVLIFTSFNKMNDVLVSDLRSRFGIYTNSIDGRTIRRKRQEIVDEFSNIAGAAALILNPVAAGTGLNISAANHVIHYNLEWNPAKEDQASARAYRRGQDRPVTIHRLYYANTVEEAIDERLTRKRVLSGTAVVGIHGEKEEYDDILNAIQKSPKAPV